MLRHERLDEVDPGQWIERGPVSIADATKDDRVTLQQRRRIEIALATTEVQKMIGSWIWPLQGAVRLPLHVRDQAEFGDVALGPKRMDDGRIIRWYGLWFPHRLALIENVFSMKFPAREFPSAEELQVRREFLEKHHVAYEYLDLGYTVTWDEIKTWLDEYARPLAA